MTRTLLSLALASATLTVAAHRAHADDVDVSAYEFLDVVETADGSIWKGVIVEQVPNKTYKVATADGSLHVLQAADVLKVTKAKNLNYHRGGTPRPTNVQIAPAATGTTTATTTVAAAEPAGGDPNATDTTAGPTGPAGPTDGVKALYDEPSGLGRYAHRGFRLEAETTQVTPLGTIADAHAGASYGLGGRAGYELVFGNFGLTVGGQARVTWWSLPDPPAGLNHDVAWTLETLAFARAAIYLGRVAPYLGVAAGLDTNYAYSGLVEMSHTAMGLGVDIMSGLTIAVNQRIAIDLGLDFHPATDTLDDRATMTRSSEYLAFRIGASLHL